MMRKMKLWKAALLALALLLAAVPAFAEFDLNGTGSIGVRIHTADGENVQKAHIVLYRVGDPKIQNSNLVFEPAAGFEDCDLKDAAALWKRADQTGSSPYAEAVSGSDGRVLFENLPVGLYLVGQDGFDSNGKVYFTEIEPFCVSVPMVNEEGNGWTYEIEAMPKVKPVPKPTATPAPTDAPEDVKLPQTGMLRWPIPVMAVGGVVLFSIGWALFFMKRRKNGRDA